MTFNTTISTTISSTIIRAAQNKSLNRIARYILQYFPVINKKIGNIIDAKYIPCKQTLEQSNNNLLSSIKKEIELRKKSKAY